MGRKRKKNDPGRSSHALNAGSSIPPLDTTVTASRLPFPNRPCRILFLLALVLLFILGSILGFREISSPDIGFHLGTARWIIEHGAFPRTDLFTYTVPERPYLDLQWLFQLLFYGIYQLGGTALIVTGTTVLTLGFGALLILRVWRLERRIPFSSLLLLLLFFLGQFWEARPHLLSWLWGSCLLLILEEHARGQRRWLAFLPLIMLLWVNSHSLFVLGGVIISVYLLCNVRKSGRLDRNLLLWSFAALLACLINPYHVKGILLPLIQFRDIQESSVFKSSLAGIAEFTSPFSFGEYYSEGHFILFQPRFFWQIFTVLSIIGGLAAWKQSRIYEQVLFILFLTIFWRANKNFGYFVMACFPMAASGLDQLGIWFLSRVIKKPVQMLGFPGNLNAKLVWLGGFNLLISGLIILAWTGRLHDMAWTLQKPGTGYNSSILPVGACQFINQNGIQGRILNTWDQGGYIAWTTRQKVFIYSHGEVMGSQFYRQYVLAKQPEGFPDALKNWKPSVVIVPFKNTPFWLYYLERSPDWRRVYADDLTAVFLHSSVAPPIPEMHISWPEYDISQYDTKAVDDLIRQSVHSRPQNFIEWLGGSETYPVREITLSSFYLLTGELDACLGVSLKGIEQSPFIVPELLLNIGHIMNARRRYEMADICFDTFLRLDDDPVIDREIREIRHLRPKEP